MLLPVGIPHRQLLAGRRAYARLRRQFHRQRCVAKPLHPGKNLLCHRPQFLGAVGGQQQVALQDQCVGTGSIGRVDHPHIAVALADLHLIQRRRHVLLIGKPALAVGRLPLPEPPHHTRCGAQGLPRQAELCARRLGSGAQAPDGFGCRIPTEGQLPVRVYAGIPAGGLGRPLDQLPPGKVVGIKGADPVAAIGQPVQGIIGQRNAALGTDLLYKGRQRQREVLLVRFQPGGQGFIQQGHPVIRSDLADVGAGLDRFFGQEDPYRRFGTSEGIGAEQGQFIPLADLQAVFRHPQFDLGTGRTGGAGAKVGLVVDLFGHRHAADGIFARCGAAGQVDAVGQPDSV